MTRRRSSRVRRGTAGKSTGWTFAFSFPTGCTAFSMPAFGSGFAIDMCAYADTIRDLVSMVWYACTFFGIVGLVTRTISGG